MMALKLALLTLLVCAAALVARSLGGQTLRRGPVVEPGVVQYATDTGAEYVWERPATRVKGLVVLAHGCSHSGTDWFDRGPACPTCIGLPEERRVVRAALAAGFVPLAVSSQDRAFSRCWTEDDLEPVKRTIDRVSRQLGVDNLPLFAIGASSGGSFLPMLTRVVRLTAMAMQISATHSSVLSPAFPPTAFVHMPRDTRTAVRVANNVRALEGFGVPARNWAQPPLPLTPEFFSNRSATISPQLSGRLFRALKDGNYLDDKGYLKDDPRHSNWRQALTERVPEVKEMNLKPDESAVSELLNVAWAMHELTSEFTPQTLQFFEEMLHRRAAP